MCESFKDISYSVVFDIWYMSIYLLNAFASEGCTVHHDGGLFGQFSGQSVHLDT